MSKAKHTPLPLRVELDGCYSRIVDADGHPVTTNDYETGVGLTEEVATLFATSVNARPKVEELIRMLNKAAETAASKTNRQEAAAIVLDIVLPHLAEKACELEAALKP